MAYVGERKRDTDILIGAVLLCVLYILVARWFAASGFFPLSWPFGTLDSERRAVADGFLNGALIQLVLAAAIVASSKEARRAIRSLGERVPSKAWAVALLVALIQIVVLFRGWIGDVRVLLDVSPYAIVFSLIPALDGVSQEVVFRGYLMNASRRAGLPVAGQIALSAGLFAAIHVGYGGLEGTGSASGLAHALLPVLGTFGLGLAWGYTYVVSGYRLLPVVVSHIAVILFVQPWLALAYR